MSGAAGAGGGADRGGPEGNAIVYCEGAYATPNGKTAHGLVRRTRRYRVMSVVDSRYAGQDAGFILDGHANGIPIVAGVKEALATAATTPTHLTPTHFVIGLAPDGGRLPDEARRDVLLAVDAGLNVDSGLHDFLSEDRVIAERAAARGVVIRDIRKPPPRSALHFFSGRIEEVHAFKVAVLGTDSAVGKRTTAWLLVDALQAAGTSAELVGTGQTAWMQGARFGIVLDSLVNDFVSGEIEHAVWSAWHQARPDVIVIEGQGSLMNPAYPGGFEILAAGRPDGIVMQHAPARREYDGFPGFAMDPLDLQIRVAELLSRKRVMAVTVNHEGLAPAEVGAACEAIRLETGLPACDVLLDGAGPVVDAMAPLIAAHRARARG